jgi:hypothetical protein
MTTDEACKANIAFYLFSFNTFLFCQLSVTLLNENDFAPFSKSNAEERSTGSLRNVNGNVRRRHSRCAHESTCSHFAFSRRIVRLDGSSRRRRIHIDSCHSSAVTSPHFCWCVYIDFGTVLFLDLRRPLAYMGGSGQAPVLSCRQARS